jgi:hypothetical protein
MIVSKGLRLRRQPKVGTTRLTKNGRTHKIRKGRKNKQNAPEMGVKNDEFRKNKTRRKSQDHQRKEKDDDPRRHHQEKKQRQQNNAEYGNHRQPSNGTAQREERDLRSLKINTARFFETVGCEFSLDLKGIKSAYRTRALLVHPDKGGSAHEFQTLGTHLEKIMVSINTFLSKYPNRRVK